MAVNGIALVNVKHDTLKSALEEVSAGNNATSLIITADAATPHRFVVMAMDVAGQLGFTKLSITTKNVGPKE